MRQRSSDMPSRRGHAHALAAFTLLENVIACAVIAFGLAGTFTLNSQTMSILRMAKDEAAASQVLQQRIEHLRIANWQRVSSPTWIRDRLLNTAADGASSLPNLTETVTIVPYGSTSTQVNTFSRNSAGASAGGSNASFLWQNALTITWAVTWNGVPAGKLHRREIQTTLGKGGVAK